VGAYYKSGNCYGYMSYRCKFYRQVLVSGNPPHFSGGRKVEVASGQTGMVRFLARRTSSGNGRLCLAASLVRQTDTVRRTLQARS